MNILKTLVIIADVGVFGLLLWLVFFECSPPSGVGWFSFLGILLLITLNICFIAFKNKGNTWLGLFFKRKVLEKKRKTSDLETKKKSSKRDEKKYFYKRSKFEVFCNFIVVLGIIAAILFSAYQAYYLRKDYNIKTRPFIKITVPKDVLTMRTFMGLTTNKAEHYLAFNYEQGKKATLLMAVELENVGNLPARITQLKLIITDLKGSNKVKFPFYDEKAYKDRGYILFPKESMYYKAKGENTPDNSSFLISKNKSDRVKEFDDRFSKMDRWIKNKEFIYNIYVTYKGFEGTSKRKYTTKKTLIMKSRGKSGKASLSDIY